MSDTRKFLFLLGSARSGGNTEQLARIAAARLSETVTQQWIDLAETRPAEFRDLRHEGDGNSPAPTGAERDLLDATLGATDIVIASPLYWYSVSADTKRYLDYWSGWMRLPGTDFKPRMKGKTLRGITVMGERDQRQADPLVGMLQKSAEYLSMDWAGMLLGNGSRPGDVMRDAEALRLAESFLLQRDRIPSLA